jgi:hypothetical protein
LLRDELSDPPKHELLIVDTHEAHPAEFDVRVTIHILGDNDLVSGQRHTQPILEEDERARRSIADDWQIGRPVSLAA